MNETRIEMRTRQGYRASVVVKVDFHKKSVRKENKNSLKERIN